MTIDFPSSLAHGGSYQSTKVLRDLENPDQSALQARNKKMRENLSHIVKDSIEHKDGALPQDLTERLLSAPEQNEPATQPSLPYRICSYVGNKISQAASWIGKTAKENIPEVAAISEISKINEKLNAIKTRLQTTPTGGCAARFREKSLICFGIRSEGLVSFEDVLR